MIIDGSEIAIGVTVVQEAEDMGFLISDDKNLESYFFDDAELPDRTYDVGVYLRKEDKVCGVIYCINKDMNEIPYWQGIINEVQNHTKLLCTGYM